MINTGMSTHKIKGEDNYHCREVKSERDKLKAENQQLAAQVERLREALFQAVQHWEYDGVSAEHGSAFAECSTRIDETPEQSLFEVAAKTVESLRFPVMLRKMWSGKEVQDWIRDVAKNIRTTNKSGGGDEH